MTELTLHLNRHLNASRSEVFKYFVRPNLIERWCAPEGMTLKVPKFDNKQGGNYVYEHSSKEGVHTCAGRILEYIPNEKLVTVDTVKDPQGKIIIENQTTTVEFVDHQGHTDLRITQDGFEDQTFYEECKSSWNFCLNSLERLLQDSTLKASA